MGLHRLVGRSGAALLCASTVLLASPTPAHADVPGDELTALIMGGTFMPTPSQRWQDAIVADYIDPATGGDYRPALVPYPASGASTSIPTGLANLQDAMAQQPEGLPYVVSGYSQSAQIAVLEKINLMQSGQPAPDVTFFLLGSGNRPNGGFLERFEGLVIPGMPGLAFNGAAPTDGGIATIDVGAQYDANSDFPQYPINLVAVLNAFLGFLYTHAGYGDGPLPQPVPAVWPPSQPLTGPYVDEYVPGSTDIVRQVTGDTTFYFIPTAELPLLSPLRTLGVSESWLDIIQPALRVIVEAGYDRSVPFGEPVPAQLIPIVDPVTFLIDFTKAVVQGADNAVGLFGADLPGYTELMDLLDDARLVGGRDRHSVRGGGVLAQRLHQPVHGVHRDRRPDRRRHPTAVGRHRGPAVPPRSGARPGRHTRRPGDQLTATATTSQRRREHPNPQLGSPA